MNRRKTPSLDERQHQKREIANAHIVSHVIPRYKNFFIEQEIWQRQGLNTSISRNNLRQIKENLIAGFDYIRQHAISIDANFFLEDLLYTNLTNSKLGMVNEEANVFELITTSLTIQHAGLTDISYGASLEAIRQREIRGETLENKRTSIAKGRQKFIYFVTGVGDQVNAPGMHQLTTYQIDLNKLALYNPAKFSQLHVSPHLTEFNKNACLSPCLMGNTRVDIQFDGKTQTIAYRFQRSDDCLLEKIYSLHDFVFFGGNDVLVGIALRFIELLRLVGNPYRQELLTALADPLLSKQERMKRLSAAMTMLMPGSMIIEAKIPDEILLNDAYTKIILPEVKIDENENLNNNFYYKEDVMHCKKDKDPIHFVEYLKQYAAEFASFTKIDIEEKKFTSLIEGILTEICFNGPYLYALPNFSGHIPTDLNLFAFKLLYIKNKLSLPLLKWLLTAKFVSPNDNHLHYLFNINERESAGTHDLFRALLSVRGKERKEKELLTLFFSLINQKKLQTNFCHYVAIAAHEAFGHLSTSKELAFLLEKNITLTNITDPHLISWITFKNNEILLEYMFVNQSLNINAVVNGYSWLEYAILNENKKAIHWLLDHGALLHRQHPKVMKVISSDISNRLGLTVDKDEFIDQNAVVVIVTATYHNADVYTIMGRYRVNNKLEDKWSFPGGMIEFGETPLAAGIRHLLEETSVVIDVKTVAVRELMSVKLHTEHQDENHIDNLTFLHIDLGKTLLPSVWASDNFGEVTKVNISGNILGQLLIKHKNLPIRVSNLLLFDYLIKEGVPNLSEQFSELLFAEMFPTKFIKHFTGLLDNINKILTDDDSIHFIYPEARPHLNDPFALLALKSDTINLIKGCLKKINHIIDCESKEYILTAIINLGHFPLLEFAIENGYSIDYLKKDAKCQLEELIKNQQWDMLGFICKQVPHMLYAYKRDWKEVSQLISSIPFSMIRDQINAINAENIIYTKLIYLFKKQTKNTSERELTLNAIKDILRNQPEAMEKFTEDHIQLILLSGDVELFKGCYSLPLFATLSFHSPYFYHFYNSCERVDILKYLFQNKHTDMLALLYERFPIIFQISPNSIYISDIKTREVDKDYSLQESQQEISTSRIFASYM